MKVTKTLAVTTTRSEDPGDPVAALRHPGGLLWCSESEGLVAWGEAARIDPGTGEGRFERAASELGRLFDGMEVRDEVGVPGTGPVAFGSFTFDPEAAGSVLIVPAVVVGRRRGKAWTTSIGPEPAHEPAPAPGPGEDRIRYLGSSMPELEWLEAVAAAERATDGGDLEKVVLARDVRVWSKSPLDPRRLTARLARRFPECFTFSVDGLVGATPELLVRRTGALVESRVLAGSAPRDPAPSADAELGRSLLASDKDLREHELALRSVLDVFEELCASVEVDESPHLLKLANVQHLATDVRARLDPAPTALQIAGRLHPTAAVCGLPRRSALELLRALERLDRRRYAGPVGWVDARGDGEWGIALRCAEIDGARARLFAGAGIVPGSVPEAELEETRIKLNAMQSALEGP